MMRGQMFSLDFLLSLALVFLAIGLLLRVSEYAAYNRSDERAFTELVLAAEAAGNLLVANPQLACPLENVDLQLLNCIDPQTLTNAQAIRTALGIPDDLEFSLSIPAAGITSGGTHNAQDFAEVRRQVLVHSGQVTKQEYNTTFRSRSSSTATVRIWRA